MPHRDPMHRAVPRHPRLPDQVRGAWRMLEGALARRALAPGLRPAPPRHGLIAASYNIHKCIGMDNRFDPRRIADVIGELGADVVALQEADRRFGHRTGLLDIAHIERQTGLVLVPASPIVGGHGWHGNALLVRGGRTTRVRRLALPGAEPRGALIVDLVLADGPLRVVAAHLGLLRRHRLRQAAAILAAVAEGPAMPTLLLGDMNEWRPGIASSLAAWEPMFGPFGHPVPSFPSRLPFLALDQVLGHPRGLVAATHVHDSTLARLASDHLPIWARIDFSAVPEALSAAA